MFRRRQQRNRTAHYCIVPNPRAAQFSSRAVDRLISSIRKQGGSYTVCDGDSAEQSVSRLKSVVGVGRDSRSPHPQVTRFGKVSGLIACGGDGTVRSVAEVARKANLPIGILPLGRYNSIFRSLYGGLALDAAIKQVFSKTHRSIDVGLVEDNLVIGSVGFGIVPELARQLADRKSPRFGFSWGKLAAKAALASPMHTRMITVDSFRFEIPSTLLSIHFQSNSLGLRLSPASIPDDGKIEVIFDAAMKPSGVADFIKNVYKESYVFSGQIKLFRGSHVSIAGVKGETVYVDGNFITLKTDYAELSLEPKSLHVYA